MGYCKHLLEAAKVHYDAAEHEDLMNKQRQELARQVTVAEENRRKAEEQRKLQVSSYDPSIFSKCLLLNFTSIHAYYMGAVGEKKTGG